MQFSHPALLYALFLLIIPIIVHLFQLRKFKKEQFTNVKFLQRVVSQNRKSTRLKKWLVLFCRLVVIACLVLAFAQPFIPSTQSALQQEETVIYLDNSFSMQQRGKQGELLKSAVQDLLENLPDNQPINLLTNQKIFAQVKPKTLRKKLPDLDYTSKGLSLKTAYLKAQALFSENKSSLKKFIAISDFQEINLQKNPAFKSTIETTLIPLKGEKSNNISIDSLSLNKKGNTTVLKVQLSAQDTTDQKFPVSLYNDTQLIAKSSAEFKENKTEVRFNLPRHPLEKGRVSIEDEGLRFDNTFYFSINADKKIRVAAISDKKPVYLQKIFKDTATFDFSSFTTSNIDFAQLQGTSLIILNELSNIPNGLGPLLKENMKNGNSLAMVPAKNMDFDQYNLFLKNLGLGRFTHEKQKNLKVTEINFKTPLYKNVFDKSINNFQYPSVTQSYRYEPDNNLVLTYNNQQGFLIAQKQAYIFTASLDHENSNFKNSPLIVPTFYNMALLSMRYPALYYTLGKWNTFEINWDLKSDQVVHIKNQEEDFIPRQHKFGEKLSITTKNLPKKAGNYSINANEKLIKAVSFNNNRKENNLTLAKLEDLSNVNIVSSVPIFFDRARNQNHIQEFWKWFAIFALFFLVVEMLLLKFLK